MDDTYFDKFLDGEDVLYRCWREMVDKFQQRHTSHCVLPLLLDLLLGWNTALGVKLASDNIISAEQNTNKQTNKHKQTQIHTQYIKKMEKEKKRKEEEERTTVMILWHTKNINIFLHGHSGWAPNVSNTVSCVRESQGTKLNR
jgi:hypothetical protein